MADRTSLLSRVSPDRLDRTIAAEPSWPAPTAIGVPAFLTPTSLGEVKELARMIALAEWAPECYRDLDGNYLQPKLELAILHGATVGLGPIAAIHAIALIGGTPSIWGDGALSVIEHSGLLEDMVEDYEVDDVEGLTAICTMKRCDRATPIVTRFSLAMAERAGLTRSEGPWQTYPERMLRMRARSWTMRDAFADVLRGLQLREEVEDYAGRGGARPRRNPPGESNPQGSLRPHASPRPQLMAATPVATELAASLPLASKELGAARAERQGAEAIPETVTANGSRAGHEPASAPDPSLLLNIDPTWGVQKIFQHYRAALAALSDSPKRSNPTIARFRQANIAVEERLRTKLSSRISEIDALYQRVELGSEDAAGVAIPGSSQKSSGPTQRRRLNTEFGGELAQRRVL